MPDTECAQRLLAFFTSKDSAEGIAGDLAEAREAASSFWFWRQVLATAVTLWGRTIIGAPLRSLGLAFGGCLLLASSTLGGIAAVSLFPQYLGSAPSWIVLASLWWGCALGIGASLVGVGPTRGMAACVVLAITAEAAVVLLGMTVLGSETLGAPSVVFASIAAFASVPLLTGGAIMRLRTTRDDKIGEASR
jgi:hypothetical protein